jgi:hypothetical protein
MPHIGITSTKQKTSNAKGDAPTIEKTTKSYDAEIYLTTADFSSVAPLLQSKHETTADSRKQQQAIAGS